MASFTLWQLYPCRKSPCYPLNRRLGAGGEENKLFLLPRIDPRFLDL